MKRILYFLNLIHCSSDLFFREIHKKYLLKGFIAILFLIGVQSANAQTGEALNFDWTQNNYVKLPFTISGSYTKEVWININTIVPGAYNNIISGSDEAFYLFNGQIAAFNSGTFFSGILDTVSLISGQWNYVAVTYDSSTGEMNLYKNGVLVYGSPAIVQPFSDTALYIGAYQAQTGSTFDGSIDEVRIWKVVRTAAQINDDMDSSLTGDEPGLLAYYNFNENIDGGNNTGNIGDSTLYDSAKHKCNPYDGMLVNFTLTGSTSNWIAPGAPLVAVTLNTYPDLRVSGNSTCINYNENTPSTTDSTDFGTSSGSAVSVIFTIKNNGMATLNIDSVHIGGADSADFIITSAPASSVASGASTSFKIKFGPTAMGTRNATVNVYSDDSDAIPFLYAIKGNATVILPITLQSFTGYINGITARLTWKTSAELNNKGFEILRSADGVSNWQKIGFVASNNLSSTNTYSFIDESPLQGVNTYRLQQIDLNGNSRFSSVVALNFSTKGSGISIYPNPARNVINLSFTDNKLLNTPVQVKTVTGRVLSTVTLTGNHQQLNISNMSNGIYIVSFSKGEVRRIIKQ